jgi:hypothetical protein
MGFFDLKFILLIGLTIVIFLIYREVENLRKKVNDLEINIKDVTKDNIPKIITLNTDSPVKSVIKSPVKPVVKSPVKSVVKSPVEPIVKSPVKSPLKNKLSNKLSSSSSSLQYETSSTNDDNSNSDSELTITISSLSSKHLAIYSNDNDNDQYNETQNSLLESIERSILDVEQLPQAGVLESKSKILIKQVDSIKINNNISSLNDFSEESSEKELLEEFSEKEELLEKISEESSGKILEETSEKSLKKEQNNKYTENDLDKLKMVDIKKISEDLKISLSKKINNHQKPKTKQELIKEILEKNI